MCGQGILLGRDRRYMEYLYLQVAPPTLVTVTGGNGSSYSFSVSDDIFFSFKAQAA